MKPKLLLVDDSPTQLIKLSIILEKEGYQVIKAKNGLEGINQVYIEQPDLIVSDVVMPELNGYQLCRLLKNDPMTKSIPIILLTSSLIQQQDKFWGLKAGADRYILKDAEPVFLIKELSGILQKRILLPGLGQTQVPRTKIDESVLMTKVNFLLDKLLFDSTLSNEIGNLSHYIYNQEDFFQEFFKLLSSLVDYSLAGLFLFTQNTKGELILDIKENIPEEEIVQIKKECLKSISFPDIIDIEIKIVDSSPLDPLLAKEGNGVVVLSPEFQDRHHAFLKIKNDYIGSIIVFSRQKDVYDADAKNTLDLIAIKFATVVKLFLLYEENKLMSITDGLTKVYNRRHFQDELNKFFESAVSNQEFLSLIMIDIDHFKNLNDTYGHQVGDTVLIEVSRLIKESVIKDGNVFRYGGEEFIILLPKIELEEAVGIAQNLRSLVEMKKIQSLSRITISLGVAVYSPEIKNSDGLVKKADNALYQAKEKGRNRVEY